MDQIDCSSGVIVPYYDYDTNVVFLAGKVRLPLFLTIVFIYSTLFYQGDGNIRYYEIVPEPPYAHYLSQYQSGMPQRSLGKRYHHQVQGL